MSKRGRLILNPTLQLAALVDTSRRGKGRLRIEYTGARALRWLLAAVTGGRRSRMDESLRRQLVHDGVLVRSAEVPRDVFLDPRIGLAIAANDRGRQRSRMASRRRLVRARTIVEASG